MNGLFCGYARWCACRLTVGLSAALVLAGVSGSAWAQDDKLPSAEKILEKSIEGRGGKEAFQKLTSRVSKGTMEISTAGQTGKGTLTLYEAAPNKRYFILELPGGEKHEYGTDGDVHWSIDGAQGAKLREGEDKAMAERQADFYALLHWGDQFESVETVAKEQIDDRSCYKVVLKPKVGPPETIYFDRKSGLPIRIDTVRKTEQGEIQLQTRQEDYRELDGVKWPFKTVRLATGGGATTTYTTIWESIKQNEDIPEERFALPDAVQALVGNADDKAAQPKGKKPKPQ
jgi:outer membrane lipoprotein-sorting protein